VLRDEAQIKFPYNQRLISVKVCNKPITDWSDQPKWYKIRDRRGHAIVASAVKHHSYNPMKYMYCSSSKLFGGLIVNAFSSKLVVLGLDSRPGMVKTEDY